MRILAWDIETRPIVPHGVWGLWDQNIGLNQIADPGGVMCFAARWHDDPKSKIQFFSDYHNGHEIMVQAAWDLFDEADALISWNGKGFDTKHMNREFLLQDLTPPSPFREIDLLLTARKQFKFPSNKLEFVSTALGLQGKVKHSGFDLWIRCLQGDPKAWAEMKKYNEQDVHLLIDLYDRMLPWITGHPNQNLYDGAGCPRCGSDRLHKRGTTPVGLGLYQRYVCLACGSWSRSGKSLDRVDNREDK